MMKQWMKLAVVAVAGMLVAETVSAQPSGRGGRGGRGGFGGFGGGFGGPGMNPVMAALDADKDGSLSSSEIANAAAALKTLDKNNDGKLTADELRPQRGEGGRGGGFGGGPGGPGGGERGGRGGFGGGSFVDRLMEMDANKDGKISASELPERMARIMDRADSNGDGSLDKAEIEAMAAAFGGGGGRGGRGGGERGSRGGRGGGDRPQRPSRPQ